LFGTISYEYVKSSIQCTVKQLAVCIVDRSCIDVGEICMPFVAFVVGNDLCVCEIS